LPNSPQAGSDMLNNMVASFTASNQVGESMKKVNVRDKGYSQPKKNLPPQTDFPSQHNIEE